MNARIIPFAVYIGFLALGAGLSWLAPSVPDLASWAERADLWLYPVKTAVVLGLLLYFWPRYVELRGRVVSGVGDALLAVGVGVLVYLAWVRMDWSWATQGEVTGYDPFQAGGGVGILLAGVRLLGATAVVPIMEELFWRSFLIRYVISTRFETVPLGTFTLGSFLVTVVLFGLEHHLWLAGMLAGVAYTLLLYWTGRLWPCIFAHAVTNLALGIHVLVTGEWEWW